MALEKLYLSQDIRPGVKTSAYLFFGTNYWTMGSNIDYLLHLGNPINKESGDLQQQELWISAADLSKKGKKMT